MRAVPRPNDLDMVVLIFDECTLHTGTVKVEMLVALHDIDVAQRVVEERLANLAEPTTKSVQYKRSGRNNKALMELKH